MRTSRKLAVAVAMTSSALLVASMSAPANAASSTSVVKAAAPIGNKSDYRYLISGYRWLPCKTRTYKVNLGATKDRSSTLSEIKSSFAKASKTSGIRFRYAGRTSFIPQPRKNNPSGTDFVIAWVKPGQSKHISRGANMGLVGVGGATGSYGGGQPKHLRDGWVVMNGPFIDKYLKRGFSVPTTTADKRKYWYGARGQGYMHEIGHAVGMGHAKRDRQQIMFPSMTGANKVGNYGAGDTTLLKLLGKGNNTSSCRLSGKVATRSAVPVTKIFASHS